MTKGSSLAWRICLALGLTVGFYALALGMVAVFGWAIHHEFTANTRVHGKVVLGCAFAIGVILWSLAPRIDRFPDPGVRLHREQQPALFRLIEDVARAAGQAMPAEVFLVDDVNAFVAQRGGLMGIGSRRVMGIGLPLLQVLTVAQVRAVVAHEFGHFDGGDTRLGPWIYKTRGAIIRTVDNFAKVGSVLHYPFLWYAKLFLRITQAVSRRQELAADALSVRIAGLGPACGALETVSETAPLFGVYIRNEFLGMLNGGMRPPLADGFARFLESPRGREARQSLGTEARAAGADPYDTHPPLGERLQAAKAAAGTTGAAPARGEAPALSLLAGLPELERELVMFVIGDPAVGELPVTDWTRGPAQVLPKIWREAVQEQISKLPQLTVAELTAQRPQLAQLAAKLELKSEDGQVRTDAAEWLLGALLALRLTEAGFSVHAEPGCPIELRRGDAALRPFEVLDGSDGGRFDDARWQQWCSEQGIAELPLTGAVKRPAALV